MNSEDVRVDLMMQLTLVACQRISDFGCEVADLRGGIAGEGRWSLRQGRYPFLSLY